jgi:putative Holliday junction resolvase
MRILAVDPGSKRIGIAISDPSNTIANPLAVIHHVSLAIDAAQIAQIAADQGAGLIIVGQALDENNLPTPAGRSAARFSQAIQLQTEIPVILWDESGSTQAAQSARRDMGATRKKRQGHLDEIAATVILQYYLDAKNPT